jgi:hypothetical protein
LNLLLRDAERCADVRKRQVKEKPPFPHPLPN